MARLKIERTKFSGAWIVNEPQDTPRTFIVIANGERSAAFTMAALAALGAAAVSDDEARVLEGRLDDAAAAAPPPVREARAWLAPLEAGDLDRRWQVVSQPAYIVAFQEPACWAAAAARATPEGVAVLQSAVAASRRMVQLSRTTRRPLMMIGLDTAIADLENFMVDLADFCECDVDVDGASLSAIAAAAV